MATITIQDLHEVSLMSELKTENLDAIKGGVIPIAVGIAMGTTFIAGTGIGVSLYGVTRK